MPSPDPNNTYIQSSSEIQILEFIKTLRYDKDPKTKMIVDEFEWQAVERSSRPSKMSKSDSKLHSLQYDQPITKLLSTTDGEYKFGMEVPDAMINDAITKKAGQKWKRKRFMCYGDQVANVPNKLKKDVVPGKTRSLTTTEEAVVGELAHFISIQKLRSQRCPTVEDPAVQSLLDLQKGSKASRLKSLRQKKQPAAREGSSDAHNKYYDSSDTDSDATLYSSSSEESEESANETDDADEPDMDLFNDKPNRDDDAARYGVFIHNNSTATPNSTYLGPTVTSSSLNIIQTLLDETTANELTDFMSHLITPVTGSS
ncbi:hypothetical protein Tco_0378086 [Tanacetum coccineum]